MSLEQRGIKFSNMKYERPSIEEFTNAVNYYLECISIAKSAKEQEELYRAYEIKKIKVMTMQELCTIRNYLDVTDEFYSKEQEYWDSILPTTQELENKIHQAMVSSPYREELKVLLGSIIFDKWDLDTRCINEAVLPLMVEENELITRYMKLMATATVSYEGEEIPLSKMKNYFDLVDREKRRESMFTYNHYFYEHREELDEIFDKLVKVRTRQAHELGFQSYTELAYILRGRIGYNREDIEAFREEVCTKWVPFVSKLKEEQRKRLEIPTFRLYDSPLRFKDGSPKLKVKGEDFLEATVKMFHELSKETGSYIDFLYENELMDLFDRPGKAPYDGFSENITEYKENFIFGHFNGKEVDLEVFTHEFGHSFAFKNAFERTDIIDALRNPLGQEIAETHSITMELLTSPYDYLFFDEQNLRKFHQKKLEYGAYFISAICIGDEFQHIIYDNPDMTSEERNKTYEEIHKKYNPYCDYSDVPFESWGCMWQDTAPVYSMPFYLIDYALAQTLAFQFFAESLVDKDKAWSRYLSFLEKAGTMSFPEIIKECGLLSPFDKNCFDHIYKVINDMKGTF